MVVAANRSHSPLPYAEPCISSKDVGQIEERCQVKDSYKWLDRWVILTDDSLLLGDAETRELRDALRLENLTRVIEKGPAHENAGETHNSSFRSRRSRKLGHLVEMHAEQESGTMVRAKGKEQAEEERGTEKEVLCGKEHSPPLRPVPTQASRGPSPPPSQHLKDLAWMR